MGDDASTTGYSYASYLLGKWLEIKSLSEEVNRDFLQSSNEDDDDKIVSNEEKYNFYDYISKLVNLYGELLPKVTTRPEFKEFLTEFKKYEKYHTNPKKLMDDENIGDIAAMERAIGTALEKLKILKFESVF